MVGRMSDVTRLLEAAGRGDGQAAADLLPLVYDELRRLAAARMVNERADHTLNATALVHEAFLRLVGPLDREQWDGRKHFFAAAAEAMRRILVESARRRATEKRGGQRQRIPLTEAHRVTETPDGVLALDEALTRLEAERPDRAALVKLRFFAGLTMPEAAAALGVSLATAERWWTVARAWLVAELGADDSENG
jgi:RNA polymerase sigma factor (TIGR02999 family)